MFFGTSNSPGRPMEPHDGPKIAKCGEAPATPPLGARSPDPGTDCRPTQMLSGNVKELLNCFKGSHAYFQKPSVLKQEDTTQMLDHAPVTLHFSITCTHGLVHELTHEFTRSLSQMDVS